mmetsp:Transcript_2044/g.7887  ORF Transcript_2044/g.7887 Transcript_2044/m.7887 type:complete len:226 (-) Transcript_2044:1053-1730(-)
MRLLLDYLLDDDDACCRLQNHKTRTDPTRRRASATTSTSSSTAPRPATGTRCSGPSTSPTARSLTTAPSHPTTSSCASARLPRKDHRFGRRRQRACALASVSSFWVSTVDAASTPRKRRSPDRGRIRARRCWTFGIRRADLDEARSQLFGDDGRRRGGVRDGRATERDAQQRVGDAARRPRHVEVQGRPRAGGRQSRDPQRVPAHRHGGDLRERSGNWRGVGDVI